MRTQRLTGEGLSAMRQRPLPGITTSLATGLWCHSGYRKQGALCELGVPTTPPRAETEQRNVYGRTEYRGPKSEADSSRAWPVGSSYDGCYRLFKAAFPRASKIKGFCVHGGIVGNPAK